MFFGEFQYRVDDKGRVPLPPRFRLDLKDGLVVIPGAEKCLAVYSLPEWQKLSASLSGAGTITPAKMRRLNRAIFATAFNLELDRQWRLTLPAQLREYAGITTDVVVAGVNTCLELWSKKLWDEEKMAANEQRWQIIESLERPQT
jgi:MraZ protein